MLIFENICTNNLNGRVASASLGSPHVAKCLQNINIFSLRYLLTASHRAPFFITSLVILSFHEQALKMRTTKESSYTITA